MDRRRPADTLPEAAAVQFEIHGRLGGSGRVALAIELSEMTRAIAVAGLRHRNPEMSEARAMRELMWHLHGVPLDSP